MRVVSAGWIADLFAAAASLKSLPRRGWALRGVREPESVADHSLAVALLSAAIAAARGLDPGKAALIAVLHDIAESVTGDLTPTEKASLGGKKVDELEREALERVLGGAPERVRETVLRAVQEYRDGSSEEGRLVREVDKLEMALQALLYRDQLGESGVAEFLGSALNDVSDPEIRSVIEEVAGAGA